MNNEFTVRKILAVALSTAIHMAGLSAPFVHAHPDDHVTAHHTGGAVHTHWGGHAPARHPSGAPAVDGVDHDRAVFFKAVAAIAPPIVQAPDALPGATALPVAAERAAHISVAVTHGHDPPDLGSLPSRAPPRPPVLI